MYAFKPEQSARVSISLCGSAYDTVLAVFSKVDDWSAVAEMSCNDDSDCGPQSALLVCPSGMMTSQAEKSGLQQVTFICRLPVCWHIPFCMEASAVGAGMVVETRSQGHRV